METAIFLPISLKTTNQAEAELNRVTDLSNDPRIEDFRQECHRYGISIDLNFCKGTVSYDQDKKSTIQSTALLSGLHLFVPTGPMVF